MIPHRDHAHTPRQAPDGAAVRGASADARARRRWQVTCLVALAVFGALAVTAATAGILPGEREVRDALLVGATPAVVLASRIVNPGGSWHALLPAMLLLFALSPDARRRWWLWSAALVAGGLVETSLKAALARARPEDVSAGFPSGHATAAAAFAVVVVYLVGRSALSRPQRLAVSAAVVAGAALVGLARIELRAHWPTDVVAGWALGAGLAASAAWWDLASRAGRPAPAAGRLGRVPADPRAAGS